MEVSGKTDEECDYKSLYVMSKTFKVRPMFAYYHHRDVSFRGMLKRLCLTKMLPKGSIVNHLEERFDDFFFFLDFDPIILPPEKKHINRYVLFFKTFSCSCAFFYHISYFFFSLRETSKTKSFSFH